MERTKRIALLILEEAAYAILTGVAYVVCYCLTH